ncbi:hypothetical protein L6164_003927 [Bauhinia variegata]|uniref:Uncharacterized protein n=1 Tax=Bauhinia variegata TaxID=167791 RepID=A0ACB9Q1Y3_BAUVA|nr:hypothetical protein L6164_003927 [Bauhinia variegata]
MWSNIENLKENLNKIALDVHDNDDEEEELEIYVRANGENSPFSDQRNSHTFARAKSVSRSPVANGIDPAHTPEIEQFKAEIKRLQASETEIKALSVNYAALLKEKEDQIIRLNKEYGSLKQILEVTNTNGSSSAKASNDQSPNRQHKFTSQLKNRYAGNQIQNGVAPRQDTINNGIIPALESDALHSKMESKNPNLQGKDKELANLIEGKNSSTSAVQHAPEIRRLKMELEQERDKLASIQLQFQEEQKLNKSFEEELKLLKTERDKASEEILRIRNELNEKVSEIKRLQTEQGRQKNEGVNDAMDGLKRLIKTLEKENATLKMEKNELEASLERSRKSVSGKMLHDATQIQNKDSGRISERPDPSICFPGKEEMEQSIQKLSKDLKETQRERDKALQQLTRLKQHLLEKESEESEKMDEDSKIIEGLRESNNHLRAQISHLEKTLKQAIATQEELKMANSNELLESKETIDDLNKKLANCMSTIDAKNIELLNLQTALGHNYALIEAKENLEEELARAREESAKLSQLLKDADQRADISRGEKEEILAKLSQSEKAQSEWRSRVSKLEEDNAKLRRALEQSMTRLNRMSVDSDFLVDRRIVIKLLVTYFQRNHSKEVLDLMVRMLGFSDEDKQRIGVAQQGAGKGVVRGVLGLPGRLVGGILGGSSTEASANMGSDNQSFADLWVDFLLEETEEREKRESAATGKTAEDSHGKSPNTISAVSPFSNQRLSTGTVSPFPINPSPNQNPSPPPRGYFQHSEPFGSEFSTVPLTSSDSKTSSSKLFPRY